MANINSGLGPNDPRGDRAALSNNDTGSVVSGLGAVLKADSSGLNELHKGLTLINKDLERMEKSIKALEPALKKISGLFGHATGSTSDPMSKITASPITAFAMRVTGPGVFSGPGLVGSNFSGGGGGTPTGNQSSLSGGSSKGSTITSALFSAPAMEISAQAAGWVHNKITAAQTTAAPLMQYGSQFANIGGQSNNPNAPFSYATSYNMGMRSLNPQDLSQALGTLSSSNGYFTAAMANPNGRSNKQLSRFMNASLNLNQLGGASAASGFAQEITSPQFAWYLQRSGFGGQGALINPKTHALNGPDQTYATVLRALARNPNLTAAGAEKMANDPAMVQRLMTNASSANLSSASTMDILQYAGAGMNLNKAQNLTKNNAISAQISQNQQYTQQQTTLFNQSQGALKVIAEFNTATSRVNTTLIGLNGSLIAFGVLASKGFGIVSKAGTFGAVFNKNNPLSVNGGAAGATGGAAGAAAGAAGAAAGAAGTAGIVAARSGLFSKLGSLGSSIAKHPKLSAIGLGTVANVAGGLIAGGANPTSWRSRLGGALSGAGTGAMIGALIPGLGEMGIGEIGGALIGGAIGAFTGDPPTGSTTTAGLQPNLSRNIQAMMRDNPKIKISSGHRTTTQQKNLYAMKNGVGVARPGQSNHQLGKAADLGPPSQLGWIKKNASRYGLYNPAPRSEPWHVESMGDPVSGSSVSGSSIVQAAEKWIGTPYKWGGYSHDGVDCSGFVMEVFAQFGIKLPHYSGAQFKMGTPVNGISSAQPGDLIFYGPGGSDHVGIYVGNNKFINAPHTGSSVQINSVWPGYSGIRRLVSGGAGQAIANSLLSSAGGAVPGSSLATSPQVKNSILGLNSNFISRLSNFSPFSGSASSSASAAAGVSGSAGSGSGGATVGNTASAGTIKNVGNIKTPTDFSKAVLQGLGIAPTVANVTDLNAWQQSEGQWTASGIYNVAKMHNPLNTYLAMAGSNPLDYKGSRVSTTYPNWTTGVKATVNTIKQTKSGSTNMSAIFNALKNNDNLTSFSSAAGSTGWAASHYASGMPPPSGTYAYMGDPVSSHSSGGISASSVSSAGLKTAASRVTINMPIQVVGVSQQDAKNLASMVIAQIKSNSGLSKVGGM
jgi:cell wall-associated NlpC family hydrolase